jgi:hypothetical protein
MVPGSVAGVGRLFASLAEEVKKLKAKIKIEAS